MYIVIVITTVENRTIGERVIFRHNKHLNFYRSVNIWKMILAIFLIIRLPKHDKSREHVESESYITLTLVNQTLGKNKAVSTHLHPQGHDRTKLNY
jgi:hypothetical protein